MYGQLPLKKIAPPPGRVWVRGKVRVSFRVGGQFFSGTIVLEPLEMCVKSLKSLVKGVLALDLVHCSPPRSISLAKFPEPKLQN